MTNFASSQSVLITPIFAPADEAIWKTLHNKLLEEAKLWDLDKISVDIDGVVLFDRQLERATVILVLLSPDFLASDTCMNRAHDALDRAGARYDSLVIPIFLRPIDSHSPSFDRIRHLSHYHYQGLPYYRSFSYRIIGTDSAEALNDVSRGICKAISNSLYGIQSRSDTFAPGSPHPRLSPPLPLLPMLLIIVVGVSLFLACLSFIIWKLGKSNEWVFVGQILLFTCILCIIPTGVTTVIKKHGQVMQVLVETLLFAATFLGFGFWLFGPTGGIWLVFAITLIILTEGGGRFVEWRKESTLRRLARSESYSMVAKDTQAFERLFRYEQVLYLSVPIGLIIGLITGIVYHQSHQETVEICFQSALAFASLMLICFLCIGFRRMCDPMIKVEVIQSPQLRVEKYSNIFSRIGRILLSIPSRPSILNIEKQKQQDIDLSCDISSLRTVYKYDMLHNAILLVTFFGTALSIQGVIIDFKWLIGILLITTLIFSEIPYGIGQYLLHEKVLERYTGKIYAEMVKELREYVPIFPPYAFLTALMTAGTIGGFFFFLLNLYVQGISR